MKTTPIFFALLAIALLKTSSLGYIYNSVLLNTYAKIVPRIVMLDRTHPNERPKKICILHEKGDEKIATHLRDEIVRTSRHLVDRGDILIEVRGYHDINDCAKMSVLLLLNGSRRHIFDAVDFAMRHHSMTIAYDNTLLRYGALLSLVTKERVYPIINLAALKKSGLCLDPALLQISKIYRDEGVR